MTTINPEAIRMRRRGLRQDLIQLEKQIYDLEGNYLENTREFGNIFTGWNHYVSQRHLYVAPRGPTGSSGTGSGFQSQVNKVGRGGKVTNEERLFSLSSLSSPASRRDELKKINSSKEREYCGSPTVLSSGRKRKQSQLRQEQEEEEEEEDK